MGLTLVTGRANTGRTGVVYDAVRAAADSGRRPLLLLPSRPDVLRARSELSATHPLGIHVEQLDGWIGEAWSLHGDGRRPVRPAERLAIAGDAIAHARLHALAASAATPGFVRLLSYVAREAAELPRGHVDALEPGSAVDAEMRTLLRAYRAALDERDLVELGEAALLLAGDPPDVPGPVVLHRFADVSRAREALVLALAERGEVWVTLPWEGGLPATEATRELAERLGAVASQRVHCEVGSEAGELDRLEAWLYRAPEPGPAEGAVAFCTAAGEEAEAALIASRARAAAERYGPDRVAIVFRDAARHVRRLRVALAGADVPADFDVLVPAGRTAFAVAVKRLVAAAAGADTAELAAFLRSPFAGIDAAAVDAFDARRRSSGRMNAAEAWSAASRLGPAPGRALKLAKRVTASSGASMTDWQELADALLANAHDAASLRADQVALEDAAAHRALLETVQALADARTSRLEPVAVLAALDDAEVPAGPAERPGRVQVTEAHRLRSRRFDVVIVGGLTAGEFSSEGRVNPAAKVAERLLGVARASDQARERLLFYDVCTRARRELVLARRTADSDGNAVRPSVFWEEALDLYRRPDADAALAEEEALLAETVRLADLDRAAPSLAPGRSALRTAAAAGGDTSAPPAVAAALARAGLRRGSLTDADALGALAAREEFSATELEIYARCPYRWFYERMVRPASLDVVLDARTHGSLAHRALADFYTALPERLGTQRVTPQTLRDAQALAGELFDAVVAAPGAPAAATLVERGGLAATRERVLGIVASDVGFLPGFEPARVELRFGTPDPEHPDPSGAGPVDLGGFRLRGSIDRVDAGEAGLAVIDYKSGDVPKRADIQTERRIQAALYAAVAGAVLERPVAAVLYRALKDGSARGVWAKDLIESPGLTGTDAVEDAKAVAEVVADAVALARGAADGIRAGRIPAEPVSAKACAYCPAAGFCGGGC